MPFKLKSLLARRKFMDNVIDDLLSINEFSRPGKKLKEVKAIVLHWTAHPGLSAKGNRDYFETLKKGNDGYGSAHFIVGYDGEIIRAVPETEVAYHCGTSQIDPISKKVYTDYAREKFGAYCINYASNSPNNCTIGIEMCPTDEDGNFNAATWLNTKVLVANLLKMYKLGTVDITTHGKIVGWKNCPKLFGDKPEEFQRFIQEISLIP